MADAFAEITPTPYTADTAPWQAPDPVFADDLNTPGPGGGSYAGIPEFLNGRFDEHPDAPPNSVPAAMAPADPTLPVQQGVPFPHKDAD